MSILYGNPGYYQFLPNLTSNKINSTDTKYSNTGVSLAINRGVYYYVCDEINQNDLYFKTDVYMRTNFKELGINTSGNNEGIIRITTNNENYPYMDIILQQETLNVRRLDKTNVATNIISVPHIEAYNNVIMSIEIHLNMTGDTGFDIVELWINNVLQGSKKDVNYFDKASVTMVEINHGLPSNVLETSEIYNEYSYFSNLIIGTERLGSKKCINLPTIITNSTWTLNGDVYESTEVGQSIVQKIDMDALNKINPIYDNTTIDAIMLGSDVAYSSGTNNVIKYGVSGTDFDVKSLANQSYQGVKSKIIVKNPATNDAWTVDSLSKAVFTVTSAKKEEV